MIWFTSDHHLGHASIIRYTNRPFPDVQTMDNELIDRWNAVVRGADVVYHLGDFCLGPRAMALPYLTRLNGRIRLLSNPWHHDHSWLPKKEFGVMPDWLSASKSPIELLPPIEVLEFPGYGDGRYPKPVVLCHYPIARWDRSHYGSWHLHGHCHGRYKVPGLLMDVGVDATGLFRPVSIEEVAAEMQRKTMTGIPACIRNCEERHLGIEDDETAAPISIEKMAKEGRTA